MAAVSQKIPNLIGGVSEQPDSLKLPGQLRTCTNYYPDPTFGLAKRPGLQGIRNLTGSAAEGVWFPILRDSEEKYICQISRSGGIKIWDADSGVEQTVNAIAVADQAYPTHTNDDDLAVLQINDYTFVLNRRIVVEASGSNSAAIIPYGFVTVGAIGYNTTYSVVINGTAYNFNTTDNPSVRLSVNDVLGGLAGAINGSGIYTCSVVGRYLYVARVNGADFTLEARGGASGAALEAYKGTVPAVSVLPTSFINGVKIRVLANPDGEGDDYWLRFETQNGGSSGAGSWIETIAPVTSLGFNTGTMPHAIIREANGTFTFRRLSQANANSTTQTAAVTGVVTAATVTTNTKGRYVVGQTIPTYAVTGSGLNLRLRVLSTNQDGRVLTVEPSRGGRGYANGNVVTTLEGDTFTISSVQTVTQAVDGIALQYWENREVGDIESNPNPTFVGKSITGLAFFKNRLIMLSGENVICSEAGKYFNFFASTVITFIQSDPIDLSCGSLKPIQLRHSLQTPRGLVLFADNAQYILETTTDAFSAATAEINLLSSYSQSPRIAPTDIGATLVFIEQADKSTSVYEMLIGSGDSSKPQVAELSRTVPSYVPADIKALKASSSASTFGLHSRREPNALYLFRFYNAGNERQFASWFKWELPGPIEMFEFDHDILYVVVRMNGSNSQRVLCKINLLTESPGGAILYNGEYVDVRLDLYDYNPTLVYRPAEDVTRICFRPGFHDLTGVSAEAVLLNDDEPGIRYSGPILSDLSQPDGRKYYLEVPQDVSSRKFALGYTYTSEALMPAFYVQGDNRKDTLSIPMINRIMLDSYNSGPFEVHVQSEGRPQFIQQLPQIFANQTAANAVPMVRNAQNRVPVLAKGDKTEITLVCPFPFPTAFTALTWEGTYDNRGIRGI
jgi:hypothetical protein